MVQQKGSTTIISVKGGEKALEGAFSNLASATGSKAEMGMNKKGQEFEYFKTKDGTSVTLRGFSSAKSGNEPTLEITSKSGKKLKIRAPK